MLKIMDPRKAGVLAHEIPNYVHVPLSSAHLLIGAARVTPYRWAEEDRLAVKEIGDLGKGTKKYVRAGDVRELAARQYRRNAAGGSARMKQ